MATAILFNVGFRSSCFCPLTLLSVFLSFSVEVIIWISFCICWSMFIFSICYENWINYLLNCNNSFLIRGVFMFATSISTTSASLEPPLMCMLVSLKFLSTRTSSGVLLVQVLAIQSLDNATIQSFSNQKFKMSSKKPTESSLGHWVPLYLLWDWRSDPHLLLKRFPLWQEQWRKFKPQQTGIFTSTPIIPAALKMVVCICVFAWVCMRVTGLNLVQTANYWGLLFF